MPSKRLIACLLNISEGRNQAALHQILSSVSPSISIPSSNPTLKLNIPFRITPYTSLIHIGTDYDYNRSVLTLISRNVHDLSTSILSLCHAAIDVIDLRHHEHAEHPRAGAVDLVPIHPINPAKDEGLEAECVRMAKEVGVELGKRGAGVYYYGLADGMRRSLVRRRKEVNWFKNGRGMEREAWKMVLDVTPNTRAENRNVVDERVGVTAVGVTPYVMNFNILLDSKDMDMCRRISEKVRESSVSGNGLLGVESMALRNKGGNIEIACNVRYPDVVSPKMIYDRVVDEAAAFHIQPTSSVVIGYSTEELQSKAREWLA